MDSAEAIARTLLREDHPEDAVGWFYAFSHPSRRLLVEQRGDEVALLVTAQSEYGPVGVVRATDPDLVPLVLQRPPPVRRYLMMPWSLGETIRGAIGLRHVERNRIYSTRAELLTPTPEPAVGRLRWGRHQVSIEVEGREVTVCSMLWLSDHHTELAVHTEEDYRRRGLARVAVNAMCHWLLGQGITPVYIVSTDNLASIRVAEALGFVDSGEEEMAGYVGEEPERMSDDLRRSLAETLVAMKVPGDASPMETLGEAHTLVARADDVDAGSLGLMPVSEPDEGVEPGALTLLETLGEGGMGVVALARQRSLRREVAIKWLKPGLDPGSASLIQEARVTGMLEHPNIIPIHELSHDPSLGAVVVMKRVQGQTWVELLRQEGVDRRLEGADLVRHLEILIQVCNAVHFAHTRGVIHRDIKPENVMVGEFGEVYVLDWGVALTKGGPAEPRGVIVGSPAYMAPEMTRGDTSQVTALSDVYLLGATLHHVLTGRPRHQGSNMLKTLMRAGVSEPWDYTDEVPQGLAAIANRACAHDPQERYPSALAFQQALEAYLERRAALRLHAAARAQLEELEARVQEATDDLEGERPDDSVDIASAEVVIALYHEARFGLEQALASAPELDGVEEDQRRLKLAVLTYEIARRNEHGARRMLAELDDPPADLVAAVADLRRSRLERRERLESIDRERDPAVARRQRAILGSVVIAFIIGAIMQGWIFDPEAAVDPDPERMLIIVGIGGGIVGLGTLIWWRKLTANAFNRAWARVMWIAAVGLGANRLVGYLDGAEGAHILTIDILCYALAAFSFHTWSRVPAAVGVWLLACAVVAGARPDWLHWIFDFLVTAGLIALLVDAHRLKSKMEVEEAAGRR